jgi:hypothetical protein
MAEIFISYASENRERARGLAQALGARGWSVWWDREIPLGQSFDQVIEKALASAKCVVVLWSSISVASEWVRNEASEAKRRGILIPVFIERVDAPLAFRLLNGADLRHWSGDAGDAEFVRLVERVTELLGQTASVATPPTVIPEELPRDQITKELVAKFFRSRLVRSGMGAAFVAVLAVGYVLKTRQPELHSVPDSTVTLPAKPVDPASSDFAKSIKDLSGLLGGAIPATSLAKGFHVPDLGVRIAFLTAEQSASTLGAMPQGAVVMEVESGRPMAKAGIHVGDVVLSIAGKKITSEEDLRQAIFKIGPGKTQYSYRRGGDTKTVAVDCSGCKVE